MGAQNVTKVFTHWRHLSHREARALAFMANMALDADNPPVYFGGWEAVASALGLSDAASAKRMTMQVFAALRASGATVSSGQARMNVRAEYALALEPEFTFEPKGSGRGVSWVQIPREPSRRLGNSPAEASPVHEKDTHQGAPKKHPVAHEKDTHQGVPEVQNRMSQKDTPRSTEEPLRGIQEEPDRGITRQSPYVTREPTRARPKRTAELIEDLSLEEERTRQLQGLQELQKRMDAEKKEAS